MERQSRAILSFQMMMCGDVDVETASSHLLLIAQVSPEQEKGTVQGVHKFEQDPSLMKKTSAHPARALMDVTQANGCLTPVELVILYRRKWTNDPNKLPPEKTDEEQAQEYSRELVLCEAVYWDHHDH